MPDVCLQVHTLDGPTCSVHADQLCARVGAHAVWGQVCWSWYGQFSTAHVHMGGPLCSGMLL